MRVQQLGELSRAVAVLDHVRDRLERGRGRRLHFARRSEELFDRFFDRMPKDEWIACADFTVADILLARVLRNIRRIDLLDPYPRLTAYFARALARPPWQSTLAAYAQRLRVSVSDVV